MRRDGFSFGDPNTRKVKGEASIEQTYAPRTFKTKVEPRAHAHVFICEQSGCQDTSPNPKATTSQEVIPSHECACCQDTTFSREDTFYLLYLNTHLLPTSRTLPRNSPIPLSNTPPYKAPSPKKPHSPYQTRTPKTQSQDSFPIVNILHRMHRLASAYFT